MGVCAAVMGQPSDLTGLLVAWSNGEQPAGGLLMEGVYAELRRLARGHLRRERPGHSLSPTALVHEAYLKLIDQRRVRWQNRAHFFAIAAQHMRRILVEHARARHAAKRGHGAGAIALSDCDARIDPPDVDILALNDALEKLARIDSRQSVLVELRFFGGLTVDEAAAVLGVAPITVKRDWTLARTWLYRELQGEPR
jgi:RNA polymerase sigma-70 factor, ECF subfamily